MAIAIMIGSDDPAAGAPCAVMLFCSEHLQHTCRVNEIKPHGEHYQRYVMHLITPPHQTTDTDARQASLKLAEGESGV